MLPIEDSVSRPVAMGGAKRRASPWKNLHPTEKTCCTFCRHNCCFHTCYRCKIWAPSENASLCLVSQACYISATIHLRQKLRRVLLENVIFEHYTLACMFKFWQCLQYFAAKMAAAKGLVETK